MALKWRSVRPADVPAIVDLLNTANQVDDPTRVVGPDDVVKITATDNPEQNTRLGVVGGVPVAFAALLEPAATPLATTVKSMGVVHPDQRGRGIGSELLRWQEDRARELLSGHDGSKPRWLSTDLPAEAEQSIALLSARGFHKARTWFEMARDLQGPLPQPRLPEQLQFASPLGHSEATWKTYNDAFRDHWGTSPDTREQWLAREARADYRPDLSFIALKPDTADVAGLLITRVDPAQFEARGGSFAYIHLLGVRRAWRGQGIATSLLAHALHVFATAGFARAELNVDAQSPTGAVQIYEKLGFYTAHEHSTYVKNL